MTKHDSINLNLQVEAIPERLDQALRLCTCRVMVELAQHDALNKGNELNCDIIVLLCRSGEELESHVVSMVSRRIKIPVILYLSDYNEVAELVALRMGVFDVLNGEMSANVIAERIMAVHRRNIKYPAAILEIKSNDPKVATNGCSIDFKNNTLWIGNESIEFTKTEMKLVEVLLARVGDIVTRKELDAVIKNVAGLNINTRTVDSHIKRIRQKIREAGTKISVIKSVYGEGYKFVPPDLPLKN